MDVEFCDLTYTVSRPRTLFKTKRPEKRILRSVSGRFKSGELTAIIGHSGAGKSSLLDILAGFRSRGIQGELLTNGQPRDGRTFSKNTCYLAQDELLQPLLTLNELMEFAARLKLPSNTSHQDRLNKITEIINTLGLQECRNTRTEQLSGGQKKRLSIGLELLSNPPVFFLDEPTSGLDNVSAKQCLVHLQALAHQGRTIVCAIHQPSALLFELFDHVYVMSQGLCVYQGSIAGVVSFLEAAGLPCPVHHNPADFVIEMTDGEEANNIKRLSLSIENGKMSWKGYSHAIPDGSVEEQLASEGKNGQEKSTITSLLLNKFKYKSKTKHESSFPTSSIYQFLLITKTMLLQVSRNRTSLWIQLIHHTLCAVLLGTMFYDRANDGTEFFIHIKCALGIVVFHAYTWMFVPILTYPLTVKLLKREYLNRWYSFNAYYFALSLSTIPAKLFFSMIFLSILYVMWGQPLELTRFCIYCMVGIVVCLVAEGLGYTIGSTFSITNGTAVGPGALAVFLGLAIYGFDFAREVPAWVNVVMQFSFIRGGLVALIIDMFGMGREQLHCSDDRFGYCHFQNPKNILRLGDLDNRSVGAEMAKLCGILLFFRILFYAALRRRMKT